MKKSQWPSLSIVHLGSMMEALDRASLCLIIEKRVVSKLHHYIVEIVGQ